jgi:hypothetical protein
MIFSNQLNCYKKLKNIIFIINKIIFIMLNMQVEKDPIESLCKLRLEFANCTDIVKNHIIRCNIDYIILDEWLDLMAELDSMTDELRDSNPIIQVIAELCNTYQFEYFAYILKKIESCTTVRNCIYKFIKQNLLKDNDSIMQILYNVTTINTIIIHAANFTFFKFVMENHYRYIFDHRLFICRIIEKFSNVKKDNTRYFELVQNALIVLNLDLKDEIIISHIFKIDNVAMVKIFMDNNFRPKLSHIRKIINFNNSVSILQMISNYVNFNELLENYRVPQNKTDALMYLQSMNVDIGKLMLVNFWEDLFKKN